jgi:hypothetical protein
VPLCEQGKTINNARGAHSIADLRDDFCASPVDSMNAQG